MKKIIVAIFKKVFCNNNLHSEYSFITMEDTYHVCRVCQRRVEFTQEEYYTLAGY